MAKGKWLFIAFLWIAASGIAALGYKWFVVPEQEKSKAELASIAQAQKKEEQSKIFKGTIASARHDVEINFALNPFSGFAILRDTRLQDDLSKQKIGLTLIDDESVYSDPIKALKNGTIQMGAFTLSSWIEAVAKSDDLTAATIIGILDESVGVDAICAHKDAIPNVDAINDKDVKFILTPDNELLARVVMSNFRMGNLTKNSFVKVKDAAAVFDVYRKAKPDAKQVYVLWEPYVTKMLDNPNVTVLIDTSRIRGYMPDVLVVNRDFLFKNKQAVKIFMETYLRGLYRYTSNPVDLQKLVIEDASKLNAPLSEKAAQRIVKGIWWKNTSENYAHLGVTEGNVQHISDMISNITRVLINTGVIAKDPTGGKPNMLYYDGILAMMKEQNFHPGFQPESVRNAVVLPSLTDEQWGKLIAVGQLNVPPLKFARGSDSIVDTEVLDELIGTLKAAPAYYLEIRGNASTGGDMDANKALAEMRAKAAMTYLADRQIGKNRMRFVVGELTGETSVTFMLGQMPY